MKKVLILFILLTVLASIPLLSGCEITGTGSGKIITEEKDVTDFTSIDVEGTFEVEIIRSDSFSTTITADSSYFDYVAVSKEGETLKIYLNPRHTFTDFTLEARDLKAKITMPVLHRLNLSGASNGTVAGFKSSEDFILEVSGASSVDMDDIEVGDIGFTISGASKVSGNVTAGDASFTVSGASKAELGGSGNNILLNASGASTVNLVDFPLNDAVVHLSGASEATLNVKGRMDCILSDAARLYFLGNPTMGNISVTGASTIKHK